MSKFNIIQEFKKSVNQYPDNIAVCDATQELTFTELYTLAQKIASHLNAQTEQKAIIPIVLDSTAEYLAALFGVWLSGRIAVPLEATQPAQRIENIIEQCNAKFTLDSTQLQKAKECEPNTLKTELGIDDDAVIFFTSGSTGKPKGIIHTINSYGGGIYRHQVMFDTNPNDIFAYSSPFYFIAQTMLFPTLLSGGKIYIVPQEARRNIKELENFIKDAGVTQLFMSPAILKYYENKTTTLRRVFTGSERVAGIAPNNDYQITIIYGMSETTPQVTYFELDKAYDNTPIGKPFPGVEFILLDNDGNEVKSGEEGEICLKGEFTKGYFAQEEATKELYKGGVLHTKDIGKLDENGNLLYINRKDWMLKINGQRVEPSEIEVILKEIDGIDNAIVKGFERNGTQAYMCAYFVASKPITEEEIKKILSKNLPLYMIPTYFIEMDSFPLNANGKLDRLSLEPPLTSSLQSKYVEPESDTQRELCAAFSTILGIEKIGIDDNFIALGGDSIMCVKLQSLCPELPLTSKIIYTHKTPRQIANELNECENIEFENLENYPLSQTQLGIYIESINRKGEIAYNNPRLITFHNKIDAQKLTEAIEQTVAAHPYIKTTMGVSATGEPIQIDNSNAEYQLSITKIESIDTIKDRLVRPFDIENERLFRFEVFEDANNNCYLFLDLHHIIFDGTSFEVLMSDIQRAYDGEKLEVETFNGFRVAQLEEYQRTQPQYNEAKLWHETTLGDINTSSLPITDHPTSDREFDIHSLNTTATTSQIEQLCSEYKVTENVLFCAAFSYMLSVYNNDKNTFFATIYNGRNTIKTASTIAMMVKTLPLYTSFEGVNTLGELLQTTKGSLLEAMNNDLYSFAEVCSSFGLSSDLLFAYQGDLKDLDNLCESEVCNENLLENATGSKISIQVFKKDNSYTVECQYNAQSYSETLIKNFIGLLDNIIIGFTQNSALDKISLCNEEQLTALDIFNHTEVEYNRDATLVSLFKEQVERNPRATAVVFKERTYTYQEVDDISDRLANHICSKSINKGDVVSVLIERSEFMALATLGVLKSGCIYQPLDPSYPKERLNFMMTDANSKLVIADSQLTDIIENNELEIVLTEDIKSLPEGKANIEITPEDKYIILYTSGSTGLPKGCLLMHSNMVVLLNWCKRHFEITSESRFSSYASYGFDASMFDTYQALCFGGALYIIPEEMRLNLIELEEYFNTCGITHSLITTQVGRQFALSAELTTLKHLCVGGEKLSSLEPPKGYKLHNLYGPSECTVCVTGYIVDKLEENIPIGTATENTKLYVVDKHNRRVPVGALGELLVAGAQVGAGYLGRDELTAKVFTNNPFNSNKEYSRIYRTGDIVRYLADGNIEFVGRRDSQVKVRGFRIELSEVEAILSQFPEVKDVTVQAYDKESGGKFIAAYIVGDTKIDINALSEFVLENKPPYILPEVIIQLDEIPLTVNHKVDKRALPKPELQLEEENDNQRELNILEQEIKDIVLETLALKEIGITTALRNGGLSSITAIKLSIQLFKRFGVTLDSKELVKGYSIVDIENEILRVMLSGNATPTNITEIETAKEQRTSYPLSASQMGVYIDTMKNPTLTTYNIPIMLKFPSVIASDKIASTVELLVRRNPSFSVRFDISSNEVQQIVMPSSFNIESTTYSDIEELNSIAHQFVRPFNLAKGGLCRALIAKGDNHNYLLLDFHHLVFDGSSCNLFIDNLTTLLNGGEVTEPSYTFLDFTQDELNRNNSKAEEFYNKKLIEVESSSELPADLNGNLEDGNLKEVSQEVLNPKIDSFCKDNSLTPAQLFLSALHYTTSRYTNSNISCINTVSSGRSNIKIAETYGMFVNTLPLAATLSPKSVEEYIKECAQDFEESIENENYPFATLATKYNLTTNLMYSYLVGVINDYKVGEDKIELISLEDQITGTKSKLSIHIERPTQNYAITAQYNDAIYSEKLIQSFIEAMTVVLNNFIENKEAKVTSISMLSATQQNLLSKFKEEASGEIPIELYHKAIEKFALETPNTKALIAKDKELTYKEFNQEANKIANAIIQKGIESGSRIALLLPRESYLILSMFGVMKAGGAYIPCDPEYPTSRTEYILEDSNAKYIITTKDRAADFPADKVLIIDELLACNDTQNPELEIPSSSLAYLIYTSGSTGKPKGVMLHHKGISNYLTAHPSNRHVYAFTQNASVYLSVTTVSFDMSLKEIGVTLFNGKTLVLASEDEANNPILLTELFERTCADCFNATPSRMLGYMEYEPLCAALGRCKVIMSGGESYSTKLLSKLQEATNAQIFNTYGPTEITVSSNAKDLTHCHEISIGAPLYNYKELIVDNDGNPLPVGVVGELYIGGIGLAVGYNNLEEMTADKFIEIASERYYKSGDFAKWTPVGDVVILGRKDNQIKLRGLRIEIGEIETAMSKIEGIDRVAVKVVSVNDKEHLCGYFTAQSEMSSEAIKEELKLSLAHYMVPTVYMQLDKMPQTLNGKTDLKSLPTPTLTTQKREIEAAKGKTEEMICQIFARTLELDEVGATDNFFDLGGTSLSVTRIIIEAQKVGLSIAYGDLFSYPTPRGLSDLMKSSSDEGEDTEITRYDYTAIDEVLKQNTLDSFMNGESLPMKYVLLTGATGFLGIHILRELLENYPDTKVHCLIRSKGTITADKRLKSILYYYFEKTYEELFGSRIFITAGDVTSPDAIDSITNLGIDSVINCAANVKHFSKGSDIEDTNIGGVVNLIDFCKKSSARLIHISTMSIGGMSVDNYPTPGSALHENELYLGQFLDNKYIHSKFLAERHILQAIADKELSAKIMRVGNLSARNSDGEFQINFSTNSFMGRLRSFNLLGYAPFATLDGTVEFSPIDEVSGAILKLATTPEQCVVFHPYNHHLIFMVDIFREMTKLGLEVEPTDTQIYKDALSIAKNDEAKAKILSSIIAYEDMAHGKVAVPIGKHNASTMQILYRLGFHWSTTSNSYINRMLSALSTLGYFDKN